MLFNTKMPSKRRFTVFLSFLLVVATTTFFNACKKENFLVEKTTHPISELQNLSPTITVSGLKYLNSWEGDNSTFFDSKFVASTEKLIRDNVSTNANGTQREQLSTMIDVLSRMRGGWIKTVRNTLMKPSDHGVAFLVIVTFKDVEIDPNLLKQAQNGNVIVYKRWLVHDPETNKVSISTNYESKTPFVVTRKPGAIDPPNFGKLVDINWSIK